MSNLDIRSEKRGEWHVVTVPAGIRVTVYSLPNKKAAQAARDAIAVGVSDFPWNVDKDGLRAALSAFQEARGASLSDAVSRALAAVPAADPQGWNRSNIESLDASRAARAAFIAREDADGYTEAVKPDDIEVGDEISFRYVVLGSRGVFGLAGFRGLPRLERGQSRTVTVRGVVIREGRVMTRHGNNYDEFMDGLRFPMRNPVWLGDDGATGPLETPVTVDWLTRVRRRPRKG